MHAHLAVYNEAGTALLGRLPEFAKFTVQEEFLGLGSLSIDYPKGATNSALLDLDSANLVPVIDGVEQDDWYLLEDDSDDPAATGKDSILTTVTGRGALAYFEDAEVYPWNYDPAGAEELPNGDPGPGSLLNKALVHDFADASPGTIMSTFIDRAKARGALQNITYDFTPTHDSNGTPWPVGYSISYPIGQDYTKVLQGFADAGWADFRMKKLVLQMYAPSTLLGLDRPTVTLRLGREVTSGPRRRSRRTVRNKLLVQGDEGALIEASALSPPPGQRRREGFDGRGGVTDVGTLRAVGQVEVGILMHPAEGFTLAYVPDAPGAPQPFIHYGLGDLIRYDQVRALDNTAYMPMRVRTIAREFTPAGQSNLSLELNDIIVEFEMRLARRIEAVLNGSTSNNRAPVPPTPGADKTIPQAPQGVTVESLAYVTKDGLTRTAATISWLPVLYNTDGTPYDDFGSYLVTIRLDGDEHWRAIRHTSETTLNISNLRPGGTIDVAVATQDFTGHVSAPTAVFDVVLADDATPPPVPSAPTITPYLGTLLIRWDGRGASGEYVAQGLKDAGGVLQPMADGGFHHVNVWMSQAVNFAITDPGVTKVGQIAGAPDSLVVTDLPVGQSFYFALTAVDRLGNESARGAISAPAVPEYVVAPDIADAAVTTAKVAVGAINAAAIADGAVTTAKILDAQIISAKIVDAAIVSAKIGDAAIVTAKVGDAAITTAKIADLAVQDAKIANLGVGKLTAGVLSVAVTLSGSISTAASGKRVVINSTGIRLYDAADTVSVALDTASGAGLFKGVILSGSSIGAVSITGATIQTASSGPRIILGPDTPDPYAKTNVGIVIVGNPANTQHARITDIAYTTYGTADENSAIRIAGGVAGAIPGEVVDGFLENQLIVFPRDDTDEQHLEAGSVGIDGLAQGVGIRVVRHVTSGGYMPGVFGFRMGPNFPIISAKYINGSAIGFESAGTVSCTYNVSTTAAHRASAFNTSISSMQAKEAFSDYDHLAVVKSVRSRKWRYKDGVVADTARFRHGPVAEDLPNELLVDVPDPFDGTKLAKSTDLAVMVGVLWGALHQAANDWEPRITALEEKGARK